MLVAVADVDFIRIGIWKAEAAEMLRHNKTHGGITGRSAYFCGKMISLCCDIISLFLAHLPVWISSYYYTYCDVDSCENCYWKHVTSHFGCGHCAAFHLEKFKRGSTFECWEGKRKQPTCNCAHTSSISLQNSLAIFFGICD